MRRTVLFVYTLWALRSAIVNGEDFLFGTISGVMLYHSGDQEGYTYLTTSGEVHYLDYHFSKNLLFSYGNKQLFKQTLDPNRTSDVVDAQLVKEFSKCYGFAVDWLHDRIYAANCSETTADILAFGLNGEDQRTVVSWERPFRPYNKQIQMEIDPYKGILFWSDDHRIQSVETSGEGYNPNIIKTVTAVRAIALDVRMRRVYYVGKYMNETFLYSVNYTGGEEAMHSNIPRLINTYELGILPDKFFWTNYMGGKDVLYEAPLNITDPDDVKPLTTVEKFVFRMKILHPTLQECPPGQTNWPPNTCTPTLNPNSASRLEIEEDCRFGVIVLSVLLVLGVVLVAVILVKVVGKYWHHLGGETLRVPYSRSRGQEGDGESTAGATEYHKGEDHVNLA